MFSCKFNDEKRKYSSGKTQNSIKDRCVPFLSSWKNKQTNKQNVQCIRKGTLVDLTVHHRVQAAQ